MAFQLKEAVLKKIAIGIPMGLALLAIPAAAQQYPGPYLSLGAGGQYLEDLSVTGTGGRSASLKYEWGPVGIGAAGYSFGNGFRAEIELGYRHNDAKSVELPSGATTSSSSDRVKANAGATSYMVNGLYDFNFLNWPVVPHVGVGLGAATVRINNFGHDTPFAYQFIGGADYRITPKLSVGVDYRYLGTDSLNLRNSSLVASQANYYNHAGLIHLTYSFGEPPRKPEPMVPATYAPPPPPPPAQAPPPQPQAFAVYFALNSTVLDRDARQTIAEAADAAKSGRYTHLNVVGHTDTSGSAAHNQDLSERRAAAVRNELIRQGVPNDEITTSGRGETDLAVPTGNHVREPRNRRVVIEAQTPAT